jgi:hypothetical protein
MRKDLTRRHREHGGHGIFGEWEGLFNLNFNYTEFGTIKNTAGSNNFVLSVKQWKDILIEPNAFPVSALYNDNPFVKEIIRTGREIA